MAGQHKMMQTCLVWPAQDDANMFGLGSTSHMMQTCLVWAAQVT